MSIKNNFEPLIIVFCCQWCSYAGGDMAGTSHLVYPANVRVIRVPCSGRVSPNLVLRAFQRGADAVLIAGCHPGDCHYISGNNLAYRRFHLFGSFLEFIGIEPERFGFHWISASEGPKFARIMTETTETIRSLGPNLKLRGQR
ncbi:MAG: hydrogenase iron-sulfur subunit [Bacillota bacterium]|nr:hydrogenase iron-sulfur subunit [Bacillota bacterium]